MTTGRTGPALMTATTASGAEVEVVVKFKASCEMGTTSLAAEALAAMLATDLGLPMPRPYLVEIDPDFADSIADPTIRAKVIASVGTNFGTERIPSGFYALPTGKPLPEAIRPTALEVLAFDTLIANPDRRLGNPNYQTNGRAMFIYDHELALMTKAIINWRPPWEPLGVQFPVLLSPHTTHVFASEFKGKPVDLERLRNAFGAVTPERIDLYRSSLPQTWLTRDVDQMIDYVRQLKSNLARAIQNIEEALR